MVLDALRERLRDDDGPAVVVDGLTETFRLYHEKPSGLKEMLYRFRRPSYTDFNALEDISFTVERGEAVGVVGHNGSGKSTLLKVLARILPPDQGTVQTRGRVASLLELGAGFHGDLSGRENIFLNGAILGLARAEIEERFDEIVDFAGVGPFLDTAVRNYSSGMYVRLGFAIAVTVDPDVLLVDEVLSVGDAEFQHRSLERMRQFHQEGKTLLVVSHDLEAIESLCDRVLVLDRGRIAFDGSVGQGLTMYRQLTSPVTGDDEGGERGRHRAVDVVAVQLTDRGGEPSLAWRAEHTVDHVKASAGHTADIARLKGELAKERAKQAASVDAREHLRVRKELVKEQLTPDVLDAKRLVDAVRGDD